jgi:DNA-binding NtrC family response regulator
MKQRDKSSATTSRPVGHALSAPHPASAGKRATLLQIHPVPASRSEILGVAVHFLIESERAEGKSTPGLSEDAATFLSSRGWDAKDLASRMAHAVVSNQGSLITAADLAKR